MIGFRSKITQKTLGLLFLNPQREYYVNELAKILDIDPGNLYRKLKELEAEGILISEIRGNQRYFSLNKNYSLLKEIKKAYEAEFGLPVLLKKKLVEIKGLKKAYIFGSYANNSLDRESDIDVLLVGNHSSIEARKSILPLQRKIGRIINIVDISLKEFDVRKKKKDEFIKNIFSEKVIEIF